MNEKKKKVLKIVSGCIGIMAIGLGAMYAVSNSDNEDYIPNDTSENQIVNTSTATTTAIHSTTLTTTATTTSTEMTTTTTTTTNTDSVVATQEVFQVVPKTNTQTEVEVITIQTETTTIPNNIEAETETEPQNINKYIVFKPSTHYIHMSDCRWTDNSCYEISDTNGIEARKCTECNPEVEIVSEYVPENNMTYLGNLKITGYVASGNPTHSGVYPYVGGVAMNKNYIWEHGLTWGTTIYIDGLGYYTLNDDGCDYGVIDVFCNTESECYALTSHGDVYVVN